MASTTWSSATALRRYDREPVIPYCLNAGEWVSLGRANFERFLQLLDQPERSSNGPFLGWLSASLKGYPDTENLKTRLHLRDDGQRPFVELEPADHPLAVEQHSGITLDRVGVILSQYAHDRTAA